MLQRFESVRNRWVGGGTAILAIAIAVVVGMDVQPPVAAQTEGTSRTCSNMTLHGDYGLLAVGQRALPPFLGGGTEKLVATAMWTFHGDGTFLNQGTGGGLHGEVTGIEPAHDGILGTYEVNSNCTGTMQWQPPVPAPPIVYSFVIVNNGREVKAAVMSPLPNITTVELVRK
jgi:hypothetical protein